MFCSPHQERWRNRSGATEDVCINAMTSILNIGRRKLDSTKKKTNHTHGNSGKTGLQSGKGKALRVVNESLHSYFGRLKEESTPFATRVIREEVGTSTRDDNPDDVCLPPHMSKRRCYKRWCYERGWIPTKKRKATGLYHPIDKYNERPHDDDAQVPLWP